MERDVFFLFFKQGQYRSKSQNCVQEGSKNSWKADWHSPSTLNITSSWSRHIIVTGLYYLHQATHWEPVLGEGRHAVVWEIWLLGGRSLQRPLWGYHLGDWTMTPELVEWCQQNSYELATTGLKAKRWNEFALAMTHHALFSTATKQARYSFGCDDKKGYFVRKITNKLFLIPSEKRNKPVFCSLVPQIIFITYIKSGICPAKCISHEWSHQRELNSLYA